MIKCWYFSFTLEKDENKLSCCPRKKKKYEDDDEVPGVGDERHDGLVVDHDVAAAGALDHLTGALVHDLGRKSGSRTRLRHRNIAKFRQNGHNDINC